MSSPAQFQANRANAFKSTGPCTPEGKAASARNALKHGFRGREVVLKGIESSAEFAEFRDAFYLELSPAGAVETSLVDRIIAAEWRLRRIRRLESATLADQLAESAGEDLPDEPGHPQDHEAYECESAILCDAHHAVTDRLQQLYRFEIQFERSIERSLRQLQQLRKSRLLRAEESRPPEPPAEAMVAAQAPNSHEQSQPRAAVAGHSPLPAPRCLTLVPKGHSCRPDEPLIPAEAVNANG